MIRCYTIKDGDAKKCIAHFGLGLIGTAIYEELSARVGLVEDRGYKFDWLAIDTQYHILDEIIGQAQSCSTLTILWTAGKAGFNMTDEDVVTEIHVFQALCSYLIKDKSPYNSENVRIIFMSSAGGLFEGQTCIDRLSQPHPLRPYGRSKLLIENWLKEVWPFAYHIIRPSTVYSTNYKSGQRLGLIQVLVQNALRHQVTHIFGNENTLRDYVSTDAIAVYVVDHLLSNNWYPSLTDFAISGKPISIHELLCHVQLMLHRPIYRQFSLDKLNAANITFHPDLKPMNMPDSDVKREISIMLERVAL